MGADALEPGQMIMGAGRKVLVVWTKLKMRRNKMNILSVEQCAIKTDAELALLFQAATNALASEEIGSPNRQKIIGVLRNIHAARRVKHHAVRRPTFL